MKKTLVGLFFLSGMVFSSQALVLAPDTDYRFTPGDADLADLDHYTYWTWGFKNVEIPAGYQVSKAELSFKQIYNWNSAPNWLYLYLLDRAEISNGYRTEEGVPSSGKLKSFSDYDGNDDAFRTGGAWDSRNPIVSTRTQIGVYSDPDGPGTKENLTCSFGTLGLLDELDAYIKNGNNFGLGFDPDCHFYNCGVNFTLRIEKTPPPPTSVPDAGSTIWLLAAAFGALPLARRALRL